MKLHVQLALVLLMITCMLALPSTVFTTAPSAASSLPNQANNDSTILVVQNSQTRFWFADNALNLLEISHDTVNVSEFAAMNISKYKIIIVGTQIGRAEEVDSYLDSVSAEVEAWVTSGGCIMVSGQYVNASVFDLSGALCYDQGSGYYAWLPGKPGFVSVSTDWVNVIDNHHPITENFTDYDLSNWGSSADGYFILTSGETPLAVHAGYPDRPVLYAQTLGSGKIVATGLDPDYHGFIYNARGEEGKQSAQNLLKAILGWFSGQGTPVNDSVIQNGGFEQGLAGWTHAGDGFLDVASDNPHDGNYSMKISSSISQQAYFYQYLNFPNASFAFSFWVFRVEQNSWTACYLDRDWDGNTARVVSSLVIQDDKIYLNAWDNPYAPGQQAYNYDVSVGVWHNVTFAANATLGIQNLYIDGNFIETLKSSSGNVFNPDMLCFGDVSNGACNGTFYFDDIALNALGTAITTPPPPPPPPPPQGNGAVIRIEPENVTVKKDDVFTVNVTIENVSASPGIAGIQFTITWDPAVLTALNLTDVVFHEVTPPAEYDNIWQLQNTIGQGQAKYAYTWQDAVRAQAGGYLPISGNHTVATIVFKAVNEGVTTLRLSTLKVAGPNAEQLSVSFSAVASTVNVVDCMLADINSDGKVDLYDALIMANHFGCKIGDANWNSNADMNNDRQIDIYDVIILAAAFKA